MMMKLSLTILTMALAANSAASSGFRQMGSSLMGTPLEDGSPFEFGTDIQMSEDGNVMAVLSNQDNGGSISVYQRELLADAEDVAADVSWNLLMERHNITQQEGVGGANFALSRDGEVIAIRRPSLYDTVTGLVNIYWTTGGRVIGDGRATRTCAGKTPMAMDITDDSPVFGSTIWLLVGCDELNKFKGQAQLMRWFGSSSSFEPWLTLDGENNQDRFGFRVAINANHSEMMQLAISSPNYDRKRGKVQVFNFDPRSNLTQAGSDILGAARNDQFGFAMDFTSSPKPSLVISAPQCHVGGTSRGCVSVHDWHPSSPNSYDEGEWRLAGSVITGEEDNDRFGRSVAISNDGDRFAASSFHHKRQTGYVKLYERIDDSSFIRTGKLEGEASMGRWGFSIASNGNGNIVASGAPRMQNDSEESVGTVKVFLDESPFCGQPPRPESTISDDYMFLSRSLCRDNNNKIVLDPQQCVALISFDGSTACRWYEGLATAAPSSMPSLSPSSMPSVSPSASPTSVDVTPSPSASPSMIPSLASSDSPSDVPSATPTQEPTFSPTVTPPTISTPAPTLSAMPSEAPSMAPTELRPTPTLRRRKNLPSEDGGISIDFDDVKWWLLAIVFCGSICTCNAWMCRRAARRHESEADDKDDDDDIVKPEIDDVSSSSTFDLENQSNA